MALLPYPTATMAARAAGGGVREAATRDRPQRHRGGGEGQFQSANFARRCGALAQAARLRTACLAFVVTTAGCAKAHETQIAAPESPKAAAASAPTIPAKAVQRQVVVDATCANEATTAFSCRTEGGKQLSVCLSGDPQQAEYRFGEPGHAPEVRLTTGPKGGKPILARAGYSGGGESQARFEGSGTGYVVFSRMVRTRFDGEGNEPEFSSGVVVEKNGKQLAELKCANPRDADIDSEKLGPLATRDDEAFFLPVP